MGLLDRMFRIIRASLNSLINQPEDPEKILEQAVDDMQQDLIQMRQAVAQAIATQKRTERKASQAQAAAEQWYRRAQLALSAGDDNLARDALTRRKSHQVTVTTMNAQLSQQAELVFKLKEELRTLEQKISEAKTKKNLYIARANSAKASMKINEMLSNVGKSSALSAFEKMEDKVMELEARSKAMAELGSNQLDQKFAALEANDDVEAELAAMKANLIQGTDTPQLPSTQAE
ncbi:MULTISPECIES: PspA/IM30 family protein [unclassified Moorena]|uniref:PspA/IM30 family protein n=1 Tax=unclassified Moorena TaxID=2683338 RepID=UPI001401750A|nr:MULTISPECIES: PspA/IM30 family protein [unclassified Moorena]NEO11646.1 PspA/IM30 family protein [Moorena sp. SIO3E8]NEQ01205.1 PspA/IM30 family protein [Moorena sp. SIO3F7]